MWETHSNDYRVFSKMVDLFTHSLVLYLPRWRLSQISHPGDIQYVNFLPMCTSVNLIPVGCPLPHCPYPPPPPPPNPILLQTIATLHMTSWRPCWWSRTKASLSSGIHVNSSGKISFVLTPNMAALSRGCKPRIDRRKSPLFPFVTLI